MFDSIRLKLTLWYSGILALVIIVFAGATYFLIVRTLDKNMDMRLTELAENFRVAVISEQKEKDKASPPEPTISEEVTEFRFQDFKFAVFTIDGQFIAATAEGDLLEPDFSQIFSMIRSNNESYRVFSQNFLVNDTYYKLFVYGNLRESNNLKRTLLEIFLLTVPFTILGAGLGGYFLARKSLQPIVEMSSHAKRISAKNLHERLPVANEKDELGNLAAAFNELLSRLDTSFEQQRRFMADASHELRTPLAIVRGESEVALSKTTRTTLEYQESLAIVHDESKRLTKIVEDLFTLARADSRQFRTNLKQVYLDEIAADCVRAIRTLAEKRHIEIEFSARETQIAGDEKLLHRLFLNLLDNAVKYNRDHGKISIVVENRQVIITNTGLKISEDEQLKIFERFYRTDKARSRGQETYSSGAGLGLSIAKWIAELHEAELKLLRSDETESVFAVTFRR